MTIRSAAAALALTLVAGLAHAAPAYRVLDRIPGADGGWDYVGVDAARNRVLVNRSSAVMAVDLGSGAVTPSLTQATRGHAALPVLGGAEILVTNGGDDTAVFVDGATGAVRARVSTGKGPDDAIVDPRSGLALIMDHAGGDITLIDPKTHMVVGTIVVGGTLEAAAVDGAGRAYVNVEDKGQIAVIDIAARKVSARYAMAGCEGPTGIAFDAADKLLISSCDGVAAVVRADNGKVLQRLKIGDGADGVAYDAARKLAFIPAGRDGTLSIFRVKDGVFSLVQTLTTRRSARTIALDPRTGRVYLPSAQMEPPATPGGRPVMVPGSFQLLVVGL